MSSPLDYREPPTADPPPPPRSLRTWLILLVIWTAGTIICLLEFGVIGWILLHLL